MQTWIFWILTIVIEFYVKISNVYKISFLFIEHIFAQLIEQQQHIRLNNFNWFAIGSIVRFILVRINILFITMPKLRRFSEHHFSILKTLFQAEEVLNHCNRSEFVSVRWLSIDKARFPLTLYVCLYMYNWIRYVITNWCTFVSRRKGNWKCVRMGSEWTTGAKLHKQTSKERIKKRRYFVYWSVKLQ